VDAGVKLGQTLPFNSTTSITFRKSLDDTTEEINEHRKKLSWEILGKN